MARGTDFGGIHSHRDLNLIQQSLVVDPAEPKLNLVEIPGADGSRDLSTQPAGRVTFKDRKITWTFALYPGGNWDDKHRQVSNRLNGLECRITLDTLPAYYFQGRLAVKKYKLDNQLRQITVEATCRPYMLLQHPTRVLLPFCGKNLLDLTALEQMGGAGITRTLTDTGIRATWKSGAYSYAVFKICPLRLLAGQTITLSTTITRGGKGEAYIRLGYSSDDASFRTAKVGLYGTGKITLEVTEEDPRYDWLVLWIYANNGQVAAEMSTADYVDYSNLQIELGSRATAYEAYIPSTDPVTVTLTNERKPAIPTIICTGATELTVGGAEYSLNAGTHTVLDFQLEEGQTEVTLSGTGAAAIIYQEGSL